MNYLPILFNHNPCQPIGKYEPTSGMITLIDGQEITLEQLHNIGFGGLVVEEVWKNIDGKDVRFIKKFRLMELSIDATVVVK